ncbi:zinc dependent phospholipase C family protein [Clostridium tagluense]|uniref:zinc dependent phospholipase C family protein n=1 Tax=Clostridium tagluense TaxID=360422 RepID=UPI001CF1FF69|nr:zinc dependent phospholipase C family protein [Clostridium tagluense]MCB2297873.1 zinc dependent phospholipase C family protein [Clostridium tagluense]
MPSSVMHYCIANKILQLIKLDRNLFIIGNFAPDAHNHTREGRRKSHFQKINTDYDISAFKNKYMVGEFNDFVLGYYCHLVADTMSFNNFNLRYLQGESEEEKIKKIRICYDDYSILNSKLLNHYRFTKENMFLPEFSCIKEIQSERLSSIISEFQQNFDHISKEEILSILNFQVVLNEVNDIAEKCVADIKNSRII